MDRDENDVERLTSLVSGEFMPALVPGLEWPSRRQAIYVARGEEEGRVCKVAISSDMDGVGVGENGGDRQHLSGVGLDDIDSFRLGMHGVLPIRVGPSAASD